MGSGLTQLVVFKLGSEEYGFDISKVREIHAMEEIAKVHGSSSYIEGVVNLRGRLLTVISLRKRFAMEGLEPAAPGAAKIVVVDAPDAPVGFVVDEVIEVARISKEDVEDAPHYVKKNIEADYILGIAKVEGRLITIVDPVKVLELSCEPEEGAGGEKHG
jgi:purine-binding chemotaxis protein CheW